MRRLLPACVALALSLMPVRGIASPDEHDDEEESAGPPLALRVDVSGLGSAYENIRTDVEARGVPVLEAQAPEGTADVVVDWVNPDDFHYTIEVRVTLSDKKEASRKAECNGCTATNLVDKVLETLEGAIDEAKQQPGPEPEPEPAPAAAVDDTGTETASPSDRKTGGGPLGKMGWAGVSLMVVGVATAGTGGAFLGLGERKPGDQPTKLRDFQPPGIALAATGGALLVTGLVLLVLDRKRAKKNVALVPQLVPGMATLSVAGQF